MNVSIRSRGKGTWELTVDLGRDANGQRRRKFVNVKGTKSKAQQKLRELLSLDDKGIPIDTQKMTLNQWLAKWLSDYVAPKLRQKSQERYEGLIRNHIVPSLGNNELTNVTPSDSRRWRPGCLQTGWPPRG